MGKPARVAEPQPIVIYATPGFDSYTYELDPHSARYLGHDEEGASFPSRVTIAFDSKHIESAASGQVVEQAVRMLTGLTPEALVAQGGVEVWHSRKSELLWKWPRARK
jgi:hypothetical protein